MVGRSLDGSGCDWLALGVVGLILILRRPPAALVAVGAERDRLAAERDVLADDRRRLNGRVDDLQARINELTVANTELQNEPRTWRPDGPAGRMLKLAYDEFPRLERREIQQVGDLLMHFHGHPATAWRAQVDGREIEMGAPKVGVISLAPVGGCLLYTSPSPRDLSTSRMPSSA